MAAESFREGFIEPPLIKQLQIILKQYPDDGQILKELIQNAEDAGAKTIKFLYDHNQYPNDGSLYHKGLAAYQGPALYAYNDAVFSDGDWKGIRMIHDSIKSKDPMKVGRFGLGFKSVFHITDLPGIISGNQVAFLDPRQLFFKHKKTVELDGETWEDESKTSSYAWNLSTDLLSNYTNQFKPFMHDIFSTNKKTFESRNFNGTVFRFPLRRKKSEISKTIYNVDKIYSLMELLEKEGHLLLLFLKHIERIEFLELFPGKEKPELKLSVSCSRENKALEIRQEFVETIKQMQQHKSKVEFCNYLLETTLQTKLDNSNMDCCERKRWAVTQYYGGGDAGNVISILASKSQNIPLVGVALPLDDNVTEQLTPSGSVFCFLPMPLESDNETGLNFHVNGYFAVDHNRRHLKWPAKDQSLEHSTDEDLLWNSSLLKYVIPCAINELLHYAILLHKQKKISDEQVYAIFPSTTTLKDQWLPLLEKFKEKAIKTTSLYSASTKMWIKPRDAYLIKREDAPYKDTLKVLLINGKIPFCEPPIHVLDMLRGSVKDVTSSIIHSAVTKQASILTKLQKQNMIQYFYHICKTTDLNMLINLELLEILDGTCQKFESRNKDNVLYLETEECPRILFPGGIDNVIVNYKPSDDIYETMHNIALSGKTQLTILQADDVAKLLKSIFNGVETYTPNSPHLGISQEWLERLWAFINKHNLNLAEFRGIPMMPLSSKEWGILSTSIPYIVDKSTEWSLSDIGLNSEVLEKIGCKVLKEWNNVAGSISWKIIDSYVSPPTINGMINALMKCNSNGGLLGKINNLNDHQKIILRNAIGNEKSELGLRQKTFLRGLPLIKCYKTKNDLKENWFSFKNIKCFAELDFDIPLYYVIGKGKENKRLATKFGASIESQTVVLKKYIFPKLNDQFYDQESIQRVMEQVLQHLQQHNDNFLHDVGKIPFLTTENKKFVKPCEVMDPSDDILKNLFKILDVFPCGKFSDRKSIAKLDGIFREVSEHDVLELVKYLNYSVNVTTQMCTQGKDLLQLLSKKGVNFLSNDTYSQISKMKWLPAKVEYPNDYPEKLCWFGKANVLHSPDEIVSAKYEYVIGSVKPVLETSGIDPHLVDVLKLNKLPSDECIVSHLKNIRTVHTQLEKKDKTNVTMLTKEIYQMLNQSMTNKRLPQVQRVLTNSGSWIWNGDTFTTAAHVVLANAAVDTNPYVSCLPEEYAKLSGFFISLNVQKTVKLTDVLMMMNDYHKKKTATEEEKKRDLHKCLEILLALIDGENDVPEHTPLPIHVLSSDDTFEMASLANCAYCDQDMWTKGIDDVRDNLGEGEELYVLHEIIPPFIAKKIGVPSLTSKYLDSEPIEYGQSEPLTTRLNRLLDDYKDGISVLKELLQNADDAGAKKVAFIYDCRDFRSSSTILIDKNMKELQGPALLSYNDAQFTDEDFANIVKLSGATKKEKLDKVGRFGLGFNAVYNLTDAPSFISNHSVVILDPHLKYLGDAVKDASHPGIRLQFTKHGNKIRRFKDQFKPFENIMHMGVDIQNLQHYNGTLFRLPLRTPEQAQQSQISRKSYEKKDIQELFELFQKNAKNILLFTQNVIEIDFFEFPNDGQQLVKCGHLEKSLVQLLHSLNRSESNSLLTPDWNDELKILSHAHEVLSTDTPRRSSYIMKTEVELNAGEMFAIGSSGINHWLISTVVGSGASRILARQEQNMLPVGGIAVELQQVENKYKPLLLKSEHKFDGQVFCFLPLPIQSELPFHINGYFAVESTRRQLCAQQFLEKTDSKAFWNEVLMKDAVKEAFVQALCDMVSHHSLFPWLEKYILGLFPTSVDETLEGKMNTIFTFTEAFYTSICERPLHIMPSHSTWMSFTKIHYLSPGMRNIVSKDLGNIGDMIFATCINYFSKQSTTGFVDLPWEVLDQMLSIDRVREVVESKMIMFEHFYSSILLGRETEFKNENFHKLIIFGLLESESKVDNILMQKKCVPVTGTQRFLKPTELVDPDGSLRDLYDEDVNPFPVWLLQNGNPNAMHSNLRQNIRLALQNLGMRISDLPKDEIIFQAKTVQFLSKEMGTKRIRCILQLLNNKLNDHHTQDGFLDGMKEVLYLPIADKPINWPFPWQNDHFDGEFIKINAGYSTHQQDLISCSEFITHFPLQHAGDLQKSLGYGKREILFSQIERQLDCIVSNVNTLGTQLLSTIEPIMDKIYHYLDSKAKENPEHMAYIKENCQTKELIMMKYSVSKGFGKTEQRMVFVTPQQCAREKCDGEPYLFSLPYNVSRHSSLVEALEIKAIFPVESLIQALTNIKYAENPLSENGDTLTIVRNIAAMLAKKFPNESSSTLEGYGHIYLPDSNGIMTSSVNLCFDNCHDCPWIKSADKQFLHKSIPFEEAERLGVKTFRKQMFSKYQSGIPFGQSEKLTNRIKRILEGYPCDKEIMNEILQNADDAGATEVHFILDPRTHPGEKLFEPMWKPLQGPALLVYNDKPFTEEDLEGIRNLGEGSKSNDPLSTGKYGVGFNCVYHLTDTPTFLTTVIGKGQTLVAFDPQCKYVPGSEPHNPGQMWKNVKGLKRNFPDVFKCYQVPFETAGGTLFRFPLRSEDTESDISHNSMNAERIMELFTTFSESLGEALLFVNNVKKVKLSKINTNGRIKIVDKVELDMTGESHKQKRMYDEAVQCAAKVVTAGDVENFQFARNHYAVNVEHQSEVKKWLVVQQIGFESQSDLSDISERYRKKKATMLPRGGVAYLLSVAKTNQPSYSKFTRTSNENKANKCEPRHKLFCFLPLPGEISYPMHVNGYFVLDHESRKDLWHDENENSLNVKWNKLLMQKVVAPCYNEVMEYVKENIARKGKFSYLKRKLQEFINIFPQNKQEDVYMKYLESSIFEHMMLHKTELLPVFVRKSIWKDHEREPSLEIVDLHWYPLCSDENKIAYFTPVVTSEDLAISVQQPIEQQQKEIKKQIKKIQYIRNILLNCRFPLTLANETVLKKIKIFASKSDQTAEYMSPENVLKFLILKSEELELPVHIKQSVFVSISGLIHMYKFVKTYLDHNLNNVPLLLRADGIVDMFKTGQTCLLSNYSDLMQFRSDLFADKMYLSCGIKGIDEYLKPLTCENLALNMEYQLPKLKYYGMNKNVLFDLQDKRSMQWLVRLWAFIGSQCSNNKSDGELVNFMQVIKPLEKWCILPVKSNKYELWPLFYIVQLVSLQCGLSMLRYDRDTHIIEVLEKMLFPQVYIPIIEEMKSDHLAMIKIIEEIVPNVSKPDGILVAFGNVSSKFHIDFSKLTTTEGTSVLKYFSDSINMLEKSVPNAKAILMNLPLYEAQSGDMISLSNTEFQYYTMPVDIPSLKGWKPNNQNVYLKKCCELDQLHKFIGIIHLNPVETYLWHVLDYFALLDDGTIHGHLFFLKTLIENPPQNPHTKNPLQKLLDKMKDTPMLKNINGTLLTVTKFYHAEVQIFCRFESNFPISPYDGIEWKSFLCKIGLVHKLNGKLVLKYAKIIEREASSLGDSQDLQRKSKLLYKAVMGQIYLDENPLSQIADSLKEIAFIPTEPLPPDLLSLCSPHPVNQKFVKLDQSTLSRNQNVFWTQCPILIAWVKPSNDICDLLGIKNPLTLQQIVSNLKAVINVQSRILNSKISLNLIRFIKATFRSIVCNKKKENISELMNIRCIPVNEGTQLVYPTQITMGIRCEEIAQHVTPYLCAFPLGLFEHHSLLLEMGATQKPTVQQYANVLRYIYDEIQNETLHGNELNAVVYALKGLFQLATDDDSISTLDQLHLLTNKDHLEYSQKLVFIDEPWLTERIEKLDRIFFSNEEKIGQSQVVENAFRKLKPEIKPDFLSQIVKENVDASSEELQKTAQCVDWEERLASNEFANGVLRLMRNSEDQQAPFKNEKDDAQDLKLVENLGIIKVYELDQVNTYLVYNNQRLPNSDAQLPYFIDEVEEIRILLSASNSLASDSLRGRMCEIINKLLKHKLKGDRAIILLNRILSCPVEDIESLLNTEKVKSYEGYTNMHISTSCLPRPGQYVPLHFHHLLQQSIELLQVGEYVAFEVFDYLDVGIGDEQNTNTDGDIENVVYRYARVTKVLTKEGTYCNYYYEIDLGSDDDKKVHEMVHASDLYRFERKPKTSGPILVYSKADEDVPDVSKVPRPEGDLSHIKSQITETLEDAWKLEEGIKRKIIKRLFLQWHPDKNSDCVELATEVFQFIQNEIDRLVNGKGRSEVDGKAGSYAGGDGFYGFNFNQFRGRARSHQRQRDQFEDDYREHSSGRSSYYTPPRFEGKNPQPHEAKRWMRQAENDLLAVPNDMGTFNEWACFKAHQAAEKALKATQFAKDSGLKDNQHALPSLCDAIADDECLNWASELENLVKSSAAMRYPDRHYGGQTPHDAYSDSTAQRVKTLACQILEKCQVYILSQHH